MKVDNVIVSSTCDSYYLDFWPIVSRIWKVKFNYNPVLFLVHSDKSVKVSEEYGKVIYFEPIRDIPLHIQAQCSRYWLPVTDLNATWMTSDIDMLPISKQYFIDNLRHIPDDKFVNMNARGVGIFPCCYNVAKGSTFKEILDLPDSYEEYLKQTRWWEFKKDHTHSPQNSGFELYHWGIDEYYPNRKMEQYPYKERFVLTGRNGSPARDTCPLRVDRQRYDVWDENGVRTERYLDAHSLRPYHIHKEKIDRLVSLIMKEA
jgi:hypothetical protein